MKKKKKIINHKKIKILINEFVYELKYNNNL